MELEVLTPGQTAPGDSAAFAPVASSGSAGSVAGLRAMGLVSAGTLAVVPFLPIVGPLCPLRRITGVPCPLCGGTTAGLALLRGDLGAAVAASPLALALGALIVAAWMVWALARIGLISGETLQRAERLRPPPKPMLAVLGASWLFQLHRYDFI